MQGSARADNKSINLDDLQAINQGAPAKMSSEVNSVNYLDHVKPTEEAEKPVLTIKENASDDAIDNLLL